MPKTTRQTPAPRNVGSFTPGNQTPRNFNEAIEMLIRADNNIVNFARGPSGEAAGKQKK